MFAKRLGEVSICLAAFAGNSQLLLAQTVVPTPIPECSDPQCQQHRGMDAPCIPQQYPSGPPPCNTPAGRYPVETGIQGECPPSRPPRQIYICQCPDCRHERGGDQESSPYQPESQPQPGAYIAPPQTGVQVAPSRQTILGGMSIRFPELRIGLPSLELPTRTTRTRGAHMEIDPTVADYRSLPSQGAESAQRQTFAVASRPNSGGAESNRRGETENQPAGPEVDELRRRCKEMESQLKSKEALLDQKLAELEMQLNHIRSVQVPAVYPPLPQPMPAIPAVPCDPCPPSVGGVPHSGPGMIPLEGHRVNQVPSGPVGEMIDPMPLHRNVPLPSPIVVPAEEIPAPLPEPIFERQNFEEPVEKGGSTLKKLQSWLSGGKVITTAHSEPVQTPKASRTTPRRLPKPSLSR